MPACVHMFVHGFEGFFLCMEMRCLFDASVLLKKRSGRESSEIPASVCSVFIGMELCTDSISRPLKKRSLLWLTSVSGEASDMMQRAVIVGYRICTGPRLSKEDLDWSRELS